MRLETWKVKTVLDNLGELRAIITNVAGDLKWYRVEKMTEDGLQVLFEDNEKINAESENT